MEPDDALIDKASQAFSTRDFATALDIILPMVDRAHPVATGMLGLAYQLGAGVEQDAERAISLYQRAVELGDAYSAHNLGRLYMNGTEDVEANIELSNIYYNLAKEMGLKYEAAEE